MNQRSRNKHSNKKTQRITGGKPIFGRSYNKLLAGVISDCIKLEETKGKYIGIVGTGENVPNRGEIKILLRSWAPGHKTILKIMAKMKGWGLVEDKYMPLMDDLKRFFDYYVDSDKSGRAINFVFVDFPPTTRDTSLVSVSKLLETESGNTHIYKNIRTYRELNKLRMEVNATTDLIELMAKCLEGITLSLAEVCEELVEDERLFRKNENVATETGVVFMEKMITEARYQFFKGEYNPKKFNKHKENLNVELEGNNRSGTGFGIPAIFRPRPRDPHTPTHTLQKPAVDLSTGDLHSVGF